MKKIIRNIEWGFERLVYIANAILGQSVTFFLAVCLVIFWLTNKKFYAQDIHYCVGDLILGITFLSLFIIQKSFNRFSAVLHLKVNELVSSHEPADNSVMNVGEKTEREITELSKEYSEIIHKEEDEKDS